MNTYICSFTGRKLNALGNSYPITATVRAVSKAMALLELYKKWDHIHNVRMELLEQTVQEPVVCDECS